MQATEQLISHLSHFECSECHAVYDKQKLHSFCHDCHQPLLAKYGFLTGIDRSSFHSGHESMWRYFKLLPLSNYDEIVSLGEGLTPVISLDNLKESIGIAGLYLKDESVNPTGSFKSRGLSMAVSMVQHYGKSHCIIPTAGNAGGALSAYCAKAGMKATVVMPKNTPEYFKRECEYYGAELILEDGLIDACGKKVAELKKEYDCYDVSTMKEPFRLEGKKTMGFEIAEQFKDALPDVILYPCGGGTGLVGIWKAFKEWQEIGWLQGPLPKMIAVQSSNCQPIVRTFSGDHSAYQGQPSIANGLAVPKPFAHKLILNVLMESNGSAIAIDDQEMIEGVKRIARKEGLFIAPEGGALYASLKPLLERGIIHREDRVLMINTGAGYKYLDNLGLS